MIKTTYICDKCSNEQASREQFWSIGVWSKHDCGNYSESAQEHKLSLQVCRPCLESLGVHVIPKTNSKSEYVERSTEDILRELIQRVQP